MATTGFDGIEAMGATQIISRQRRRREVDQRMTDEFDRHAGFAIDRFFEWKNHQHPIGNVANRFQPTLPPRPNLRADVIDDRHAEPVDGGGEPKIEIGRNR